MKYTITKVLCCLLCYISIINISEAQIVSLGCQDETVGVEDLERKDFETPSGSTDIHSQGSMHNFTLPPASDFGPCKRITNISIQIDAIGVDLTNLPPDCIPTPLPYYYNIALGCPDFTPASCDTDNLLGEPNTPTFTDQNLSYNGDFDFGENLSVDIVPVMNINCTAGQTSLTSNAVVLDYEICVTVTVEDAIPAATVDLGLDIEICPGATTEIDAGTYADYLWGPNGEMTQTITVGEGVYTVTVTDDSGCTSSDEIMVTENTPLDITFDPAMPTVCDNAQISVSVEETYDLYMWSNSLTGQTVDLSPGVYDVTVTDENNCTAVNSITVENEVPPNAGDDNPIDVCNDGTTYNIDGELMVHDAGGNWSDDNFSGVDVNINPTAVDFTGVPAGTYGFTYTVPGSAPCPQDQATITVTVFEQNNAGTSDIVQLCSDPGDVDFNLLIGNPDLGGTWTDVNVLGVDLTDPFAVNFDGIPAGTYDFEYLLTANGPCGEQSAILTIVILDSAFAGLDNGDTVCEGTQYDLNGLIDGANGTGTFFDTDLSGALSGSIVNTTGLAGLSFNFTYVVGAFGSPCGQDEAIFTLNIESSLSAGDDVSDSFCTDGDINLFDILTNEDPGGTFTDLDFSGGLSGNFLNTDNITPGTYTYEYQIGDGITCPIDNSITTITFFEDPSYNISQTELTICEESCDEVEINFSGTPPFDFPIEVYSNTTGNLITTSNFTINSNAFTLTTCNTAGNNEFVNDTLNLVTDSSWYIILPMINDLNCNIDNIDDVDTLFINTITNSLYQLDTTACITDTVEINGVMLFDGNETYVDTIPGMNCDSIININVIFTQADTIMVDTTLCSGDSVIIQGIVFNEANPSLEINFENPDGCDSLLIIEVSFFPSADSLLNTMLCTGDSLIVNGTVYDFSNPVGTEILMGQSSNGCDSTVEVSLQFANDIMILINDTLCMDGSVEVGGITFDINNPLDQVILPGMGCDTIVDIDLSFHEVADTLISDIFCRDFTITVDGTLYDINNPTGNEVLENMSQFGCDSIVDIDLFFHELADTLISDIFCPDFSITVDGTIYDINNTIGVEVLENMSQFGCDSIVNIDLFFHEVADSLITGSFCPSFSITVDGTLYDINNPVGSEVLENISQFGCDSIVDIDLMFFSPVVIDYTPTICDTASVTVNGEIYNAMNTSGVETIIGGSINGCDSTINVQLNLISCTVDVLLSATNNNCAMDSTGTISLDFQSNIPLPFTIIWQGQNTGSNGSQQITSNQNMFIITDLKSDNYDIIIEDSNGVSIYQNSIVIVDNNQAITGTWIVSDSILCAGDLGSLEFQAMGGQMPFTYNWDPTVIGDTPLAQNISSAEYSLTVTDQAGCTLDTVFNFTEPEVLVATTSSLQLSCAGSADGQISIVDITGGVSPYVVTFNGDILDSFMVSGLDTGIYIIDVIDANDCMVRIMEELSAADNSNLGSYTENYQIDEGESLNLEGSVVDSNLMFEWIDPDGSLSCIDCQNPVATPLNSTTYLLTILDSMGCTQSITIFVEVIPKLVVNIHPNVFSPNGDNANDDFIFKINDAEVLAMTLSIFDRWGNRVHLGQSIENEITWDGTRNGNIMNVGIYVYRVDIQKVDGTSEMVIGDVLLID